MVVYYFRCCNDKCGRYFKVTKLGMKGLEQFGKNHPRCLYCGCRITVKSHKEAYDDYILKEDIKHDLMVLDAYEPWYGKKSDELKEIYKQRKKRLSIKELEK